MSSSIVYASVTGNTESLANTIQSVVKADYCGKIDPKALEADTIFVGFWACKFTCTDDVAAFLKQCENKKIFLFGTAGYDDTPESFAKIMDAAKSNVPSSNTIVGDFMAMGKVSASKKKALEDMDAAKFASMKPNLDRGESRPNQDELDKLSALVSKL